MYPGNRGNPPRRSGDSGGERRQMHQFQRRRRRFTSTQTTSTSHSRVDLARLQADYLGSINEAKYITDIVNAFKVLTRSLRREQISKLKLSLFALTFDKIKDLLAPEKKLSTDLHVNRSRNKPYDIRAITHSFFNDYLPNKDKTGASEDHQVTISLLQALRAIPLQIPNIAKSDLVSMINIAKNFDSRSTLSKDILIAAHSGLDIRDMVASYIKICNHRTPSSEYSFMKQEIAELLEACLIYDTNHDEDEHIPAHDINYLVTAFGKAFREVSRKPLQSKKGRDITREVFSSMGDSIDAQQLLPAMYYYSKLHGNSNKLTKTANDILNNPILRSAFALTLSFHTDNEETKPQEDLLAYLLEEFAGQDYILIRPEQQTAAGYYADILIVYTDKDGVAHTIDVEYDGLAFHHYKTTQFNYHERGKLTDRLPKNHTRDNILRLYDVAVQRFTIQDVKFDEDGTLIRTSKRFRDFCSQLNQSLARTASKDEAEASFSDTSVVSATDGVEAVTTSSKPNPASERADYSEHAATAGVILPASLYPLITANTPPIQFGSIGSILDVQRITDTDKAAKIDDTQTPKATEPESTKAKVAAWTTVSDDTSEKGYQSDYPIPTTQGQYQYTGAPVNCYFVPTIPIPVIPTLGANGQLSYVPMQFMALPVASHSHPYSSYTPVASGPRVAIASRSHMTAYPPRSAQRSYWQPSTGMPSQPAPRTGSLFHHPEATKPESAGAGKSHTPEVPTGNSLPNTHKRSPKG